MLVHTHTRRRAVNIALARGDIRSLSVDTDKVSLPLAALSLYIYCLRGGTSGALIAPAETSFRARIDASLASLKISRRSLRGIIGINGWMDRKRGLLPISLSLSLAHSPTTPITRPTFPAAGGRRLGDD